MVMIENTAVVFLCDAAFQFAAIYVGSCPCCRVSKNVWMTKVTAHAGENCDVTMANWDMAQKNCFHIQILVFIQNLTVNITHIPTIGRIHQIQNESCVNKYCKSQSNIYFVSTFSRKVDYAVKSGIWRLIILFHILIRSGFSQTKN